MCVFKTLWVAFSFLIFLSPVFAASPCDDYLELEEVRGDAALEWVSRQNAQTLSRLQADPRYQEIYDLAYAEYTSKDRLVWGRRVGNWVYNFWMDETLPLGVLRRTTPESYLAEDGQWQTIIDFNQLPKHEGKRLIYKGSTYSPNGRRVLLRLSPGGGDNVLIWEYDLVGLQWVRGGFRIPESKSYAAWLTENTILLHSNLGKRNSTRKSYPRRLQKLRRGLPLDAAEEIFAVGKGSLSLSGMALNPVKQVFLIENNLGFDESQYFLLKGEGEARQIPLPSDAKVKHKKGMGYTYRDISGFFFHCALTMTEQGIPLGIFSPTTWSRGQLEPGDELWDSESVRWTKIISEVRRLQSNLSNVSFVVVGDRESDIKDCFNEALRGEGVDCVARSKARTSACLDPREKNQKTVKITDLLLLEDPLGQIEIDVLDRQRNSHGGGGRRLKHPPGVVRKVQLDVYAKEVQIKGLSRPIYAVLAKEAFPSPSEKGGICWLLKTTLEVKDISQGQDVIEIYKKRWPIETYFKVLKSGCKIEDCRLDKYEEVEKFLAIQSMVALRLLQLTYWERESPDTSCSIILSDIQWKTLWHTFNPKKIPPKNAPSIQQCTRWIAQLGGHHDNRKSRPPGVLTMWRGWQKLVDLSEGFELALKMLCVDMGSR